MKRFIIITLIFAAGLRLQAQGYIVPNGIYTNAFPGEFDVWNSGTQINGFELVPTGKSLPTFYTNVFRFTEPVTIGVRVFLVSSNVSFSLSPILLQSFPELTEGNTYVFKAGVPFYVGVYTGAFWEPPYTFTPPFFYTDPVWGWIKLVNKNGVIQLMDSALAYQAQGIIVGTQTIIPEPSSIALVILGVALLGFHRRTIYKRCRLQQGDITE